MRRLFGMMLLLVALASGRTVTKTFARITNVVISGPAEHTLVIQNYYPSYTQHYTATWDVEYYDADVEVPDDDDDDEETEQENGGGGGGDVVFSTSVEWSISGAGAAFAEGSDTTAAEIDVVFTEGNIEDVHLTLQLHCICTAGDGVGDDHAAEFTIHSPVWDTYHPIGMYVTPCRILAPRVVGVGDPVHLQILDFCNNEYDRRVGADVQTPLDFLRTLWSLPAGFSSATTAYALTVTASGTAQNGVVGAAIDDVAPAIPANERGTRDDSAVPLESVPITVVEVASLTPDIGVEVDDGDGNPNTKTFVAPVASSGTITVTAVPSPSLPEASLPASWSLAGGTGTGKLQRTISRTTPGTTIVSCTCGTSQKTTKIIVYKIEVTNIKFNHDTSGTQGDAINLRQDYSTAFDISNGEWTKQGVNHPVCYIANKSITVKARFEVQPTEVTSAVVKATAQGASLKNLAPTTISFSNGVSSPEYVSLAMSGTTPNCVTKSTGETWQWKVASANGKTPTTVDFGTTSHTVYTILDTPKTPWNKTELNQPWVSALDFVIKDCGTDGLNSKLAVISQITTFLDSDPAWEYNIVAGYPSTCLDNIIDENNHLNCRFNLTKFMLGGAINCYDSGVAVCVTSSLLGIEAGAQRQKDFQGWFAHCYATYDNGAFDSCRASSVPLVINKPISEYEQLGGTVTKVIPTAIK